MQSKMQWDDEKAHLKANLMLTRMFEAYPDNWQALFLEGDRVQLIREDLWDVVPEGAIGVIQSVEVEGAMAEKGRPYLVEFDLTPYKMPWPDYMQDFFRQNAIETTDYMLSVSTHFGPNDLEKVAGDVEKATL